MNEYEGTQWEALMAEIDYGVPELKPCKVAIGDTRFEAVAAVSLAQKVMGMTGSSFDSFDAMLFIETNPVTLGFQNEGVEFDIAVFCFDDTSALVDSFVLKANDPTVIRPKKPYVWAVEVPSKYADLKGNLSVAFSR